MKDLLTAIRTVNNVDKMILSFICLCKSQCWAAAGLLKTDRSRSIDWDERTTALAVCFCFLFRSCVNSMRADMFFFVDPINGLIYTFLNFHVCFFFSYPLFLSPFLHPSHTLSFSFQVFGFQAGLTCQDSTGGFLPLIPIIPSFSTALYGKLIQMPAYWWVSSTCNINVNLSECRVR